jgi:hypothetical protein
MIQQRIVIMANPEQTARKLIIPIDLAGLFMMFASIPAGLFIQARALDSQLPPDAPLAIESVKFSSPTQQWEWKSGAQIDLDSKPFFTAEPITMAIALNRKVASKEWDGTRFECTNKNLPSSKIRLVFPNKNAEIGSFHAVLNSPNAGDYSFRLVPPGPVNHAVTGKPISIPVLTGDKPTIRLIEDSIVVKKFNTKANRFFDGVDSKVTYNLEFSPPIESLSKEMFVNTRSSESNPAGFNVESVKKNGDGFEILLVPFVQKAGNDPEYLELGIRPGIGFKTADGRTVAARNPIQADSKLEVVRSNKSNVIITKSPDINKPMPPSIGNEKPNPPVSPSGPPEISINGSGTAKRGELIKWNLRFPVDVDAQKVQLLEFTNAVENGPVIGPITVKPLASAKEFQLESKPVATGEYRLQIKPGTNLASGSSPYRITGPVISDKAWRVSDAPMPPPLPSPVLVISGSGVAKMGEPLAWKLTLPVEGESSKVKSLEFTNADSNGLPLGSITIDPLPGGKEYRITAKPTTAGKYLLEIKAGASLTSGSSPYRLGSSVLSDKSWKVEGEGVPPGDVSVIRSTKIEIPEGRTLGKTIVLFVDTSLFRKKYKELNEDLFINPTQSYVNFDRLRDVMFMEHFNEEDRKKYPWGTPRGENPPEYWMYKSKDLQNIWNGLADPQTKAYYKEHGVIKVVLVWCDEENQDNYIKPSKLLPNPDCNLIVIGSGVKSAKLDDAQRTIGTILQIDERNPWLLLPDSIRVMVNEVNRKK